MEKKLTPVQLDILVAELVGIGWTKTDPSLSFDPKNYQYARRMGGARFRTVERLEQSGHLFAVNDKQVRAELARKTDGLGRKVSVLGLCALESHFAAKKFDPTDGRLRVIRDRIPLQAALEKEVEEVGKRLRAEHRAERDRRADASRKARLEGVRLAFAQLGLDKFASACSDDEIISFADAVVGAEYSDRDTRHLNDEDLSAELDKLQKTATVPGSVGDEIRSRRIAAINASLLARASKSTLQEAE